MADLDITIILNRLKKSLPSTWFKDENALITAVLNGFAWGATLVYDNIVEMKLQTRIKTATAGFLDMISGDFFGDRYPRKENEPDFLFCKRIQYNLFKEKATFQALYDTLVLVLEGTGATVEIFEYGLVYDTLATQTGDDISLEDDSSILELEPFITTIPDGSYPVGLNLIDILYGEMLLEDDTQLLFEDDDTILNEFDERYNTELEHYECLVLIHGLPSTAGSITLEDDSDIFLEDNLTTLVSEYSDFTTYQYVYDAIENVKPYGTVIWVSIS